MLTFSFFESFVTDAQLIPADACKSFFFMSLSISIFHNFLKLTSNAVTSQFYKSTTSLYIIV